jgi:dienelactone hydrolase
VGETVTYKSGETQLIGYLAYDGASTQRRPGVLVVPEWWGQNEYARTRARQLAELGYVALAIDMYGDGKTVTEPSEAKELATGVFSNLDQAEERFKAGMQVLSSNQVTEPGNISAVGYCFGGGISLNMARRGVELDGVASFHGSLGAPTPAQAGVFKAKVLVLTGEADPMVPPDQVEAFRKEMADAAVPTEIHSYPGALHAFTNPAATEIGKKYQLPIAYDANADTQSWQELKEFLAELYPSTPATTTP